MSISTVTTTTVQGGYYNEIRINFKKVNSEGVDHLIPILKDLKVTDREGDNPSSQAVADDLKDSGQRVSTLPIEWKGKTEEEIREQLQPLRLHYMLQILMLRERSLRRVIDSEEFTARTNITVAEQFSLPLKQRLMLHWVQRVQEEDDDPLARQSLTNVSPRPSSTYYPTEPRRRVPTLPFPPELPPALANAELQNAGQHTAAAALEAPRGQESSASPNRRERSAQRGINPNETVKDFEKTLNRLMDSTVAGS